MGITLGSRRQVPPGRRGGCNVTKKIVHAITGLTARILGKDPRVTAIAVDYVPRRLWFVGGRSAEELGRSAFFLDVRISDGTNTKDEKARYVAQTFAAMERLLGPLHPGSGSARPSSRPRSGRAGKGALP